ncbi:MAG: hypothetical protein U1C56_02565 [Candidatus Curtissbacteria bacterium]|nr:hypothetical protein [Candidatus Curtissbacteria bacterium]
MKKKKMTHSAQVMEGIGHEMKVNPPKILAKTKKRSGVKRAEAQRRAILLSKARRRGVKVKRK